MPASRQPVIIGLLVFISVNVMALWWLQLAQKREYQSLKTDVARQAMMTPAPSVSPTPTLIGSPSAQLSSQLEKSMAGVQQQLAQLVNRVTTLERAATTTETEPTKTETKVIYVSPSPTSTTKEFVVYLGAGSTFSQNWTEISATTFTFEPSNYPQVKSITFEAGMSIQGGEVRARLKNKNSGNPLVETEVMHNTATSTWKSASFSPPSTSTTYVVELKSSSGEKANLDGARLKIVTY